MAPRGHPGETDAILNDVADLAVSKILRLGQAQIGWLGVEVTPDLGLPAAVVTVTDGAAVGEVFASLPQKFRSGLPRVLLIACPAWNREISHGAGDDFLQGGWLFGGAEAAADQHGSVNRCDNSGREKYEQKCFPAFHARLASDECRDYPF